MDSEQEVGKALWVCRQWWLTEWVGFLLSLAMAGRGQCGGQWRGVEHAHSGKRQVRKGGGWG